MSLKDWSPRDRPMDAAPVNFKVSVPIPPSIETSEASKVIVSLPQPPAIESLPAPPMIVSSPDPPMSVIGVNIARQADGRARH